MDPLGWAIFSGFPVAKISVFLRGEEGSGGKNQQWALSGCPFLLPETKIKSQGPTTASFSTLHDVLEFFFLPMRLRLRKTSW
jgi:hypothetical protein